MNKSTTITFCLSQNIPGIYFRRGVGIFWTVTPTQFRLMLSDFYFSLQVIFALIMYTYSDLTYNRTYYYPNWAIALGWVMACSSIIMIPIVMVARIIMAQGSLQQVRI